jgi:hypothetical protein
MAAYCTTDDVLAVASQLSLGTNTKPTLEQAEAIMDNIAHELDMALVSSGWTLPVTNVTLLDWLKICNIYGCAAGIFRSRLDFQAGEAWEKKYLGVKRLIPQPNTTITGDTTPFGSGFAESESWATRETEF